MVCRGQDSWDEVLQQLQSLGTLPSASRRVGCCWRCCWRVKTAAAAAAAGAAVFPAGRHHPAHLRPMSQRPAAQSPPRSLQCYCQALLGSRSPAPGASAGYGRCIQVLAVSGSWEQRSGRRRLKAMVIAPGSQAGSVSWRGTGGGPEAPPHTHGPCARTSQTQDHRLKHRRLRAPQPQQQP